MRQCSPMKKKTLPRPHPVLIGLMGCGKSSIGRRLSKKLKMPLVDLDEVIVKLAGMSIPEIFARHGEAYFRELETEALSKKIGKKVILATGGGVVLREINRKLLKAHPPVIWLKAAPEFLANRIAGDSNRPLLANQDALQKLSTLAEERYPLYAECADLVIERDGIKKNEVVVEIINFLHKRLNT